MAEHEPLIIEDVENISEAILYLIAKYPELPFVANAKTIQWQNINENEGIGIYTMQGAIYLERYISGSYVGQCPIRINYKCNPTTNADRIDGQELVSDISKWLESCSAKFTDSHITIEKIERTSPSYKIQADESGSETYTCSIRVKYFYKK